MPRVSPFSRGVIFTRARVLLALLSVRKNRGLLVVRNTNLRVSNKLIVIQFRINQFVSVLPLSSNVVKRLHNSLCSLYMISIIIGSFLGVTGRALIVRSAYIVVFSFRRGAYWKLGILTVLNSYNN